MTKLAVSGTIGRPKLFDRADGVKGHYCIGRPRGNGFTEFWSPHFGWCCAGTVYVGKELATKKLKAVIDAHKEH